jgi:hypothetical protein
MMILIGIGIGWIMGLAFVLITIPLIPSVVRQRPGILQRIPNESFTLTMAFLFYSVAILWWGILGAIIGTIHNLVSVLIPIQAFGSSNLVFSAGTTITILGIGAYASNRIPWARRHIWSMAILILLFWGWLLPTLTTINA